MGEVDSAGPLTGTKVIELGGVGPAPFCGMMLADMGASVLMLDRPGTRPRAGDTLSRGRQRLTVDLKHPRAAELVLRMVETVDVVTEGFRPGVSERLGIGPDACLARNAKVIFGRVTGWGQSGPLAGSPGHDINYIALSGALSAIGVADRPPSPPLNLVGDYGGGGMLLAFGIVCALVERSSSGHGQVVDAAMVDGSALLMAACYGNWQAGRWSLNREENTLDGGAPYYSTYETADGKYMAIGAVETKFYREALSKLGLDDIDPDKQLERRLWPSTKAKLQAIFRTKTRDEWTELLQGSETCISPVLGMDEAPGHVHNESRRTFTFADGFVQPSPAPRFGTTAVPPIRRSTAQVGWEAWGLTDEYLDGFRKAGVVQ